MNLTQSEADTLLAELVALAPPVRQAGDIDAQQYADALNNGMTTRYAMMLLDKQVKRGKLSRHKVYDPDKHHPVVVYREAVLK